MLPEIRSEGADGPNMAMAPPDSPAVLLAKLRQPVLDQHGPAASDAPPRSKQGRTTTLRKLLVADYSAVRHVYTSITLQFKHSRASRLLPTEAADF